MMSTNCAVSSCTGAISPRDAAHGLRLCPGCRRTALATLSRLPGLYQACADELEVHANQGGTRVSGWRPTGIRLNETTLAVRADVREILASWCGLVMGERGVTGPGERDVGRMAKFLAGHGNWLAAHDAAADFVDELVEIMARAEQALTPERTRRVRLGQCLEAGCGREVHAVRDGAAGRVTCEAGHPVPPHRWLSLASRTAMPVAAPVLVAAGRRPS